MNDRPIAQQRAPADAIVGALPQTAISAANAANASIELLVRLLYRGLLLRDADPAGLQVYARAMEDGWRIEDVVRSISNSPEFVSVQSQEAISQLLVFLASLPDDERTSADKERIYEGIVQHLFSTGQLDFAARVIAPKLRSPRRLTIEFDPNANQPYSVVRFIAHSPDWFSFRFSRKLYGLANIDGLVRNWLSCLVVFERYATSEFFTAGQVLISLGDDAKGPGLAFCACRPDCFLMPDPIFLATRGYNDIRRSFASTHVPWIERQALAFWRGSTTGDPTGTTDWHLLPRVRLCRIGQSRPDLFDVGIHRIAQISDPLAIQAINEAGLLRPFVPDAAFDRYRYHIDIDGNTNSWPGLFIKLLTGSPVLKVRSPLGFRQWYYDRLEPWVNFVPVEADMSDLIEKVEWLRNNDDRARSIGERGRELSTHILYEDEVDRCMQTLASAIAASGNAESEVPLTYEGR